MGAFFRNAWDILVRFFGAIGALIGGGSLRLLGLLMGADYVTGILLGILGKSKKTPDGGLSARACFVGLTRKGMMLVMIAVAAVLDEIAGQGKMLRSAATGFYICNECISLMENAVLLGVPIPGRLRRALSAIRSDKTAEKGSGNSWENEEASEGENA